MPPLLQTRALVKRFPGVVALDGVDFSLHSGEIHALCGENGAGKSTLIKTLSGIHPFGSYEGEILLADEPVRFASLRDAEAASIGVIYQELALVPELTVAENLALGREPTRAGSIDWLRMIADARRLCARFDVDLDPEQRLGDLGVGQQQLVEILRALGKDTRILILDEPTAALSDTEAQRLLEILRQLRERGIGCLYVSHRLEEVFAIADRITVLRDGRTVFGARASETSRDELVRHMVGRQITDYYPRRQPKPGEVLLSVKELDVDPSTVDGVRLRGIDFQVRAGEVLGIGGLLGAGRSELLLHLFGAWGRRRAGQVTLLGRPHLPASPADCLARGLALVTEDRKGTGLILEQSVAFNLALSSLHQFTRRGSLDPHAEHVACDALFQRLRIKAPSLETGVGGLSGGNQQKVVLGKALMTQPKVILLDEPTRGIDVGAKLEVYQLINELTEAQNAVVLVSSELPELLGMSDRILMLGEGLVGGHFERAEATAPALLAAAISATERARAVRHSAEAP